MAPGVTVLHLSDMQFGKNHRFGRLASPDVDEKSDSLLSRLTTDLKELFEHDAPRPDLLLLTGDLAETGGKKEFADVLTFAVSLSEFLKLTRDRVVIVPGNHDINRDQCSAYFSECKANDEEPQKPYWPKWGHFTTQLFREFYKDVPALTFSEAQPWTFFEITDLKVVVAGLNSTMRESHKEDDHYGWLGERQLRWFADQLRPCAERGWLRVAALHHNLRRGPTRDDENLRDFEDLQRIIAAELNAVFHGHTHDAKVDWLSPKVPILSTGSAAVKKEARPEEVPNQYQILRLRADGFERWARYYVVGQRRWTGDTSASLHGDTWKTSESVDFDHVQGTFSIRRRKPGFPEDAKPTKRAPAPTLTTTADFSLGSPEAWDSSEREFLREAFFPIAAFDQISERDKIFLGGRRGSGKSAIAVMMELNAAIPFKEAIQGESSEYGSYMDVVRDIRRIATSVDVDLKNAIRRLWLWALPVKAMQVLVNKTPPAQRTADEDVAAMARYLEMLPPPLHPNSRIGDLLTNTFRGALASLQAEGAAAFTARLLELTGNAAFHAAVAALTRKSTREEVLLVFDTLESYRIFEEDMADGLQGVVEAIVAFEADRRMDHVLVKFFLPSEILRTVFQSLPGKAQSRTVLLRWRSADLIAMLARRYLAVLERTGALPRDNIASLRSLVDLDAGARPPRTSFWYDPGFLPRCVTNRLGDEEDTFAYMLRHTQRRPRDLITQMQSIIDAAREHGEFPSISAQSVIKGVHNPKVLEQIVGDALIPYDGVLSGGMLPGATTIFYGRPRIMSKRDLRNFANELHAVYPLQNVDTSRFLNILLACGAIGVVDEASATVMRRKPYCGAHFSYLMQTEVPEAARLYFCVHPALGDLLKMKTPEGYGAIYPIPEPNEDRWLEELVGIT